MVGKHIWNSKLYFCRCRFVFTAKMYVTKILILFLFISLSCSILSFKCKICLKTEIFINVSANNGIKKTFRTSVLSSRRFSSNGKNLFIGRPNTIRAKKKPVEIHLSPDQQFLIKRIGSLVKEVLRTIKAVDGNINVRLLYDTNF